MRTDAHATPVEQFSNQLSGAVYEGAVETNEPHDSLHIRALSVNRIVAETEHGTDFVEEFWLLTSHDVRHTRFRRSVP